MLAIIQARMGSSRLPGKVMLPFGSSNVLAYQVSRVRRSKLIDKIVVATTTSSTDDEIAQFCKINNIECFRGSENDVLDRFYQCSKNYSKFSKDIIRLTADCPFSDPEVIDATIEFYFEKKCEFCNNNFKPTFPDGLDVAVFNREVLELAWSSSSMMSEREHVTSYIINNSTLTSGKIQALCYQGEIDYSSYRLTLDEKADYEVLFCLSKRVSSQANFQEIIEILDNNESLKKINKSIDRNAGYEKSLMNDKRILSDDK